MAISFVSSESKEIVCLPRFDSEDRRLIKTLSCTQQENPIAAEQECFQVYQAKSAKHCTNTERYSHKGRCRTQPRKTAHSRIAVGERG